MRSSVDNLAVTNLALPSWNPGAAKERVINFVNSVADPLSPNHLSTEHRIAVFDNDGTLWSEKPTYFEGFFLLERLEELYRTNPSVEQEVNQRPEFKKLLERNFANLHLTQKDVLHLALLTHTNIMQVEFNGMVEKWAKTARHPQTRKKFVDMVYQPMIELIRCLHENQFKVFIVTGGGVDFVRHALSNIYEIPPEQIIGSSIKYKYINKSAEGSALFREPELSSFNDFDVKPENIQLHIGKVPTLAAGNTDGDAEMLKYTNDSNKPGSSLEMVILHDDCEREYCYNEHPGSGQVLQEARTNNWIVVSMKNDFREIYPRRESALKDETSVAV